MISTRALIGLEIYLKSQGVNFASLAQASGIHLREVRNPHAMLPAKEVIDLFERAARLCRDKAFGLHFGDVAEIRDGSLLYYITAHAPTLREALIANARYGPLMVTGYRMRFEEHQGQGRWIWEFPEPLGSRAQFVDYLVSLQKKRIANMIGSAFMPVQVALCHGPLVAKGEYQRILGRHVVFEHERPEITIDRKYLTQRLPNADPDLLVLLESMANSTLDRLRGQEDVVIRTKEALTGLMAKGKLELVAAARVLDLPVRSLQRQLKQAGTSYQALIDETRKQMAEHLLHDTRIPMTQIAFLLGFSEPSAFSRAFRLWFGASPREFRRRLRGR